MSSVFVNIETKFAPRLGKLHKTIHLGSFDIREKNGTLRDVQFLDQAGNPADLTIDGDTIFRTDNPNDVHNLECLRLLIDKEPSFRELIKITDPDLELRDEMEAEDRTFEITLYLREHKSDLNLLASIHRLVVGTVAGFTDEQIFLALSKKASADPRAFLDKAGLTYIYESKDFESLALIENAIDKGVLARGIGDDQTISYKNGDILAENINKAVFHLTADDKTRINLSRMVDQVSDKSIRMEYIPTPEISDYVSVSSEAVVKTTETERVKTEGELRVEIENSVKPLIEAKFLVRSGDGVMTRYSIQNLPGSSFKKAELVEYFVKNKAQFEDIKNRANLK